MNDPLVMQVLDSARYRPYNIRCVSVEDAMSLRSLQTGGEAHFSK